MSYIQVITTVETRDDAERIALHLTKKRLAACVQILGPITSIYWWKNKIEKSNEYLLLIKSKKELYSEIEAGIKQVHPYDVPEIIAVQVIQGFEKYFNWINQVIKK